MTGDGPLATAIAARWDEVQRRVTAAALAADRDPATIRVVAVTKGFGAEVVVAAREAGLTRFGENRVQEAETKLPSAPNAEWHLVGHLQSNKARRAVESFAWIHGVDSLDLLGRLDTLAADVPRRPRLLLQVNVTDALAQHGLPLTTFVPGAPEFVALVGRLRSMSHAPVVGLMAIGPFTADVAASRTAFARARGLRDQLEQAVGRGLSELSMGMTGDFEAGIAEGATVVRIGTALFGARRTEV
jgi:pyridoxal phosphate enzyme (YggS family)